MSPHEIDQSNIQPYDEAIVEDIRRKLKGLKGVSLEEFLEAAVADAEANAISADVRQALIIKIARENNLAWAAIARETGGVTRQSAHQRWTKILNQLPDDE